MDSKRSAYSDLVYNGTKPTICLQHHCEVEKTWKNSNTARFYKREKDHCVETLCWYLGTVHFRYHFFTSDIIDIIQSAYSSIIYVCICVYIYIYTFTYIHPIYPFWIQRLKPQPTRCKRMQNASARWILGRKRNIWRAFGVLLFPGVERENGLKPKCSSTLKINLEENQRAIEMALFEAPRNGTTATFRPTS